MRKRIAADSGPSQARGSGSDELLSAGEYLDRVRERGASYDQSGLEAIDELSETDPPAEDKWKRG